MTTILVIEDEQDLLDEIVDILFFEGYDVISSKNGHEGSNLAKRHLPDLIVCDVMMPELDGYGVLQSLQGNPATSTIPFMFLTAKASKEDLRFGMSLGADDYVTKPFTSSDLIQAIKTRLAKAKHTTDIWEERTDKLRRALTVAIPHEMRTPLSIILGFSEMLAMDAQEMERQQIQHMANNIARSGQRLYQLIENYLLYAQLEVLFHTSDHKALMALAHTPNPNGMIHDFSRRKAQMVGRSDDLVFDLGENVAVGMDSDYFRKIVDELVDNAFKFSEPNSRVIVMTRYNHEKFIFGVVDYGLGMDAAQIKQIGAYVQFDRDKHEQQGSGMGLAIIKRLAELHDGHLRIESELQKGTRVTVELPRSNKTDAYMF